MRIDLKGVHHVRSKGRDYWYAWRGGPRLRGEPGSPEFVQSYNEAVAEFDAPDTSRFRSLVVAYKASHAFKKLAPTTRNGWAIFLDRISDYFGTLRVVQFDRPEKIRPIIRTWRNQWADKPRTADYAMQVLSRVLSHAVDPLGKLASNPCEGIKRLYSTDRSEIVWTDADIAALKAAASPEIGHGVDLAAHTGLRFGDLLRLSWSHIGEDAIEITTGKSKHRRTAVVPLYDELRDVLARIPKRSPTILTNSLGRPWAPGGFSGAFNKAKIKAGLADANLHFHDLRGTAATKFYVAGLPMRVIGEIMAWEEATVEKIVRRYVGRSAATRAAITQLNTKGEQKL